MEWPSEVDCCTPPWRWTTVGTPVRGRAVARERSHGRKWRGGRWLVQVMCVGTPRVAKMVGPGTVAVSLLVPKAKTRVAGRSRWNFCAKNEGIQSVKFIIWLPAKKSS
jgi:hypothetical protein